MGKTCSSTVCLSFCSQAMPTEFAACKGAPANPHRGQGEQGGRAENNRPDMKGW